MTKLQWLLRENDPGPSPLPSRVLEVGPDFDDLTSNVRLYETAGIVGKYATLSHCWKQDNKEPVKTLKANLKAHKVGIDFASLPLTFREAIMTCRTFGFHFLWIDSLCIVQDDSADWEQESANMDKIYAGSNVTIAMHSTTRGYMPYHDLRFSTGSQSAVIHVRSLTNAPDLLAHVAEAPYLDSEDKIAPNELWNTVSLRGWCYQERILSTRIIHFTENEIVFESQGGLRYCQCTHHHRQANIGFAGWLENINITQDVANHAWRRIVEQYSQRMFSREWDLLPGLAGIARRLSTEHGMGSYLAGLWKDNLLRWLCWKSVPWSPAKPSMNYCEKCRPMPRRLRQQLSPGDDQFCFPSFSWASRFGPCEFVFDPWQTSEYREVAAIDQVGCSMSERMPFGRVLSSFIELRGPLYPCLHFSTVGKDKILVGHRTVFAYIVDDRFFDRLTFPDTPNDVLKLIQGCGKQYDIDATDDLPPDNSLVFLLELHRNLHEDLSLMLVLLPMGLDQQSIVAWKDQSVEVTEDRERGQALSAPYFRRIGFARMARSSFAEPMRVINNKIVRIL